MIKSILYKYIFIIFIRARIIQPYTIRNTASNQDNRKAVAFAGLGNPQDPFRWRQSENKSHCLYFQHRIRMKLYFDTLWTTFPLLWQRTDMTPRSIIVGVHPSKMEAKRPEQDKQQQCGKIPWFILDIREWSWEER